MYIIEGIVVIIVDITVGMTVNCEYNNEKKDSDCDKGSEDSVADMTGKANNGSEYKMDSGDTRKELGTGENE